MSRQFKLKLMAKLLQNKFQNPKTKQSEIEEQLGYSSSTLQTYKNDLNVLSPCRIHPMFTNKEQIRFQTQTSITIHIVKLTSKDFI